MRLEYIENDTARRVTYKKRVKGIVKKTQELSVLCGVDACAIVYGPYDKAPVVWPSCEAEARRILMEFKRKPEMDQSQRRFTQLTFLKQSVTKAEERLVKLQRRNRELEIENLMIDLLSGKPLEQISCRDLPDLLWVVEDKIRTIQHRIQVLDGTNNNGDNNIGPGINEGVIAPNYHHHVGNEMMMMGGVTNVVGERGVWEMEAGPSQTIHGNGWHFGGSSASMRMN